MHILIWNLNILIIYGNRGKRPLLVIEEDRESDAFAMLMPFCCISCYFWSNKLKWWILASDFLFLCNKPINYLLIVGDLLYCLRLGFCFLVLFSWLPQRPFNSYRRWFSTHIILHMGFLVRVHVHFFFPRFSRGLLYSRSSSNRDYNLLYTVKKITRNLKAGRSALMIWV